MVLPLLPIAIGVSTLASLAIPFFFKTEAEEATVELNKTLKQGNFTLLQPEEKPNTKNGKTNNQKGVFFLIIAVVAIIIILGVLK